MFRAQVVSVSLLSAALAGAAVLGAPAPNGGGPLAQHALAPEQRYTFDGEVVEVLDAGAYAYLRVRAASGDRWVTTLEATRPRVTQVRVRVIGESAHFHSSRLDRDFTDLAFGIVRAR
jgi:hypothetical protein